MGADVIAWRNCPLQEQLSPPGFLSKLKLRMYQDVVEQRVPPDKRDTVKIQVRVFREGVPTDVQLTYAQIREQSESFRGGIPECATCPLSGGKSLGCYQFITYPIDAQAEELLFEFFTSGLATPNSIADQLYRDFISKQPARGTPWHDLRGEMSHERSSLALRPQPLVHTWGGFFSKKRVDSAQLLSCLFVSQSQPGVLVGFGRFWLEFADFASKRVDAPQGTVAQLIALSEHYVRLLPLAVAGQAEMLIDG